MASLVERLRGVFVKTNIFNIDDPNGNITILKEDEHEYDKDEDGIRADRFKKRNDCQSNSTSKVSIQCPIVA